jgi:hypothetical protein
VDPKRWTRVFTALIALIAGSVGARAAVRDSEVFVREAHRFLRLTRDQAPRIREAAGSAFVRLEGLDERMAILRADVEKREGALREKVRALMTEAQKAHIDASDYPTLLDNLPISLNKAQYDAVEEAAYAAAGEGRETFEKIAALNLEIDSVWRELSSKTKDVLTKSQIKRLPRLGAHIRKMRRAQAVLHQLERDAARPAAKSASEAFALDAKLARDIFLPWSEAWRRDLPAEVFFEEEGSSSWHAYRPSGEDSLARTFLWETASSLGGPEAAKSREQFRASYRNIEAAEFTVLKTSAAGGSAWAAGRLSVRGLSPLGARVESSADFTVHAVLRDGVWRVRRVRLVRGARLEAKRNKPFLRSDIKAIGFPEEVSGASELIRETVALAAADWDGDGDADVYIGGAWGGRLLRNNGRGRFKNATWVSGLDIAPAAHRAYFLDVDNNGDRDFVTTRFGLKPPKEIGVSLASGRATFSAETTTRFGDFGHYYFWKDHPTAFGDFNLDGVLDIYAAFPVRPGRAPDEYPQGTLLGRGDGSFDDRTDYRFYADRLVLERFGERALLPQTALAAQLGANVPTADLRAANGAWGAAAVLGDADGDGREDVFAAQTHGRAHFIMGGAKASGNRLYLRRKDGFYDASEVAGVGYLGEGVAGGIWFDYDDDGDLDLYVINGLRSSDPRSEDLLPLILAAARGEREVSAMWEAIRYTRGWGRIDKAFIGSQRHREDVFAVLDALTDAGGRPRFSLGQPQRNRLLRNDGGEKFTDVSFVAGVDALEDGISAAVADLDGDGAQDLLIRNRDAQGASALIWYLNRVDRGARRIRIAVRGTASNRDGIGVRAVISLKGKQRLLRVLRPVSGGAQSEMILHFGLGAAERAERIDIEWPSGKKQAFEDVRPGSYFLEEGGVLVLSIASELKNK